MGAQEKRGRKLDLYTHADCQVCISMVAEYIAVYTRYMYVCMYVCICIYIIYIYDDRPEVTMLLYSQVIQKRMIVGIGNAIKLEMGN